MSFGTDWRTLRWADGQMDASMLAEDKNDSQKFTKYEVADLALPSAGYMIDSRKLIHSVHMVQVLFMTQREQTLDNMPLGKV